MSLFRSRENRLDVKTVLGGLVQANAPDFINDRVPLHDLFFKKCFRRADDRTFKQVPPTNGFNPLGNHGVGDVNAIPGYQETQAVNGCNRDMRRISGRLRGVIPACANDPMRDHSRDQAPLSQLTIIACYPLNRKERVLSASEFNAKCLACLIEIEQRGEPITITRRGRPLAVLGPQSPEIRNRLASVGREKDESQATS